MLYLGGCKSTEPVPSSPEADGEAAASIASSEGDTPLEPEVAPQEGLAVDGEPPEEEVDVGSKPARSIEEQAKRFGATAEKVPDSDQWLIKKGLTELIVKEDSRMATLDGVSIWLDSPVSETKNRWLLGQTDEEIILPWAFGDKESKHSVATIVIDPGHGGSEDGSKNGKLSLLEKDLNLDLSLRLQKHLDRLGFKTVLTRYDDRKVDLKKRPEIANSAKADLFISVHFNAASNKEANGLETYMLTPAGQISTGDTSVSDEEEIGYSGNQYDLENFELAYRIQNSMMSRLKRTDRGVKKARWAVLKTLDCPGVLVECGFVSNDSEAQLLGTAGYRERVALALTEAIAGYVGRGNPDNS